jgi:hypothetical protein
VFVAQPLKDTFGCMALLFDQGFIGAQNLVNDTDITIKRWSPWRF